MEAQERAAHSGDTSQVGRAGEHLGAPSPAAGEQGFRAKADLSASPAFVVVVGNVAPPRSEIEPGWHEGAEEGLLSWRISQEAEWSVCSWHRGYLT